MTLIWSNDGLEFEPGVAAYSRSSGGASGSGGS